MDTEDNVPDASGAATSHATIDDKMDATIGDLYEKLTEGNPIETQQEPEEETQVKRDEKGKFAKAETEKVEAEAKETTDQSDEAVEEKAQPDIPKPASWSASDEVWKGLSPEAKELWIKREADSQKGIQKYADRLKSYEKLDAVLGNRKDLLATRYGSAERALEQLFAASDWLEKDPKGFTKYLIETYRINPAELAGQTQQNVDPTIAALYSELNNLKQTFVQQSQQAEQSRMTEVERLISEFSSKPENKYYEQLREDMGRLLDGGIATSLEDAYEKAMWQNPEVRAAILQEQENKKRLEAEERVKKAQKAVTMTVQGKSPVGVVASKPKTMDETIADAVKKAFG